MITQSIQNNSPTFGHTEVMMATRRLKPGTIKTYTNLLGQKVLKLSGDLLIGQKEKQQIFELSRKQGRYVNKVKIGKSANISLAEGDDFDIVPLAYSVRANRRPRQSIFAIARKAILNNCCISKDSEQISLRRDLIK